MKSKHIQMYQDDHLNKLGKAHTPIAYILPSKVIGHWVPEKILTIHGHVTIHLEHVTRTFIIWLNFLPLAINLLVLMKKIFIGLIFIINGVAVILVNDHVTRTF